ncbi:hypothetical protein PIB30_090844 [Stylosanthes scabra]|uniref:Uncharacterized protein n=1 Tax=Stylosanthes scabra TaxID=79078 RepID=A0ABU6ZT17_9FABA|nr:hypothetical protein [Stylosanthes scabra]
MEVANQEKISVAITYAGNVKANKENDEVYTQVTLLPRDDDQVYFYNPSLKIRIWRFGGTAVVAWGAGEPLVMEEVQLSPPHSREIHIKVVSTSLCRK